MKHTKASSFFAQSDDRHKVSHLLCTFTYSHTLQSHINTSSVWVYLRDTAKPGLWTLDWTVDWTMDWTGNDHYLFSEAENSVLKVG